MSKTDTAAKNSKNLAVPTTQAQPAGALRPSDFVHLHNHTQYSLLDGLTKIPALMEKVKEFGMDSIAITDHGTLSGAIEFYKAAKANKINPIIGLEAYMAPRSLHEKEVGKDKQYFHLIILAMNNQGYQNLMRLSTIANLEGFYYKPRIDRETLKKYSEGLIILSGCINGELGDALRQGQPKQAEEVAKWYKDIFGDRYYIEIQDHGHEDHPGHWSDQKEVNEGAIEIARKMNIPTVITGDAHYLSREDREAHEILLCVQTGSFLSDEERMTLKEFELHVADPKDVIKRWGNRLPEAITNTKAVAERCRVSIELDNILIPKFPVPKGESEKTYLQSLVQKGLHERYGKKLSQQISDRSEYELGVIEKMGYSGYFLIVADFIIWGKEQGIVFGPGRGSTAGSIVAYALKITELDPLKYDLLFERFLNPDRISMPDADIDIQDTRRDEVIQYCVDKYGADRVANIVTFGRMAARNAIRDVARVLQVPYAESDRLAKMIPPPVQGRHIPLAQSLKDDSDLKKEYTQNQQAREVFDLAIKLEGTIRSHGVHAAGVVIAPDDIVKYTPLERAQKGVIATQYSMGPVDELGLLKMDFLGLSNLTIINNALKIIKRVYQNDIDIEQISLDNEKTLELFQRGDTTGVFQFESAGMKRYLKQLQPTRFDDLIAMNALYRPGPMQWIEDFIDRKHGRKKIEYSHEAMENSLKNTYGIIVYQEQVMQIAKDMCGFSGGQADTLRKAIGKKKRDVMAKMKQEFVDGAVKTSNVQPKIIEQLWSELEKFADYAFPKAHAACYALIAYQTAYLKAHYPAAFMAALMTSDYDDTDRLAIEIAECNAMGIKVLPPDVNESFGEFAVVRHDGGDRIRFGMNAIKNVGTNTVEEIIKARAKEHFKDLEDFLTKTDLRSLNRKTLESLIKSGALDNFADRADLLESIEMMQAFASHQQKSKISGQTDLFGSESAGKEFKARLTLVAGNAELTEREQIMWERELLGIYLSKHPLADFEKILASRATPIKDLSQSMEGKPVTIGGSVADVRHIITKNGQKMAFVKLADMSGEIELILFPRVLKQTEGLWRHDAVVLVGGKVSSKDKNGNGGETKILVDNASELDQANLLQSNITIQAADPRIYVRLNSTEDEASLSMLKQAVDSSPGDTAVVLVVGPNESKKIIKIPSTVEPSEELLKNLHGIFGEESVKYQ
ncbi:DNA polymerase III subunit alpha [Candidatus Parcubacteria bacterium]|nr:DNA polymerase III subunit alpha [Candidatus Parcubacteria bacterium]